MMTGKQVGVMPSRMRAALALRACGASYQSIADALGLSNVRTAYNMVHRAEQAAEKACYAGTPVRLAPQERDRLQRALRYLLGEEAPAAA